MSAIDLTHLREWIGKPHVERDIITARQARLMEATVGPDGRELVAGAPLPPLWHWLYFLKGEPAAALGADGHPARGGFLPPVPLPNRMWAGGQLEFHHAIALDTEVEKRSTVTAVEHKQGRSGELVFVTVLHELRQDERTLVSERHDIVYKGASPAAAPAAPPAVPAPLLSRVVTPDNTMLFRYSALTFNGHRIHYDADYCRQVEGYPNLVIHGPLNATLLANFAEEIAGKRLTRFSYRGLQPAILGNALTLRAAPIGEDELVLWVTLPDGAVAMRAEAAFRAGNAA